MKNFLFFILLSLASVGCMAQSNPNTSGTLIASGAQTATVSSTARQNTTWRGGHFLINVSAWTSGTFTPHIQGQDPITLTWYDICVGTALGATGLTRISVYPGLTNSANAVCSDILPKTFRVSMVGASTPIATFSVSFLLDN